MNKALVLLLTVYAVGSAGNRHSCTLQRQDTALNKSYYVTPEATLEGFFAGFLQTVEHLFEEVFSGLHELEQLTFYAKVDLDLDIWLGLLHGDYVLNTLNLDFFGFIHLGTPEQKFRLLFDTTSSNLWVPSQNCNTRHYGCSEHSKYNSKKSLTHVKNGSSMRLSYAQGLISGFLSWDCVSVAGIEIKRQAITEAIWDTSDTLPNRVCDGYFGLGFKSLAAGGVDPPLYSMHKEKHISQPKFSLYYKNTGSSSNCGEVLFGDYDSSLINGNITFASVTDHRYWQFRSDRLHVGSTSISSSLDFIVDTSSPFIRLPDSMFKTFHTHIGATKCGNYYIVNCKTVNQLPNLVITIQGRQFSIPPCVYIIPIKTKKHTVCLSAIAPIESGWKSSASGKGLLGNIFFRVYYTIFDVTQRQIGFAQRTEWEGEHLNLQSIWKKSFLSQLIDFVG